MLKLPATAIAAFIATMGAPTLALAHGDPLPVGVCINAGNHLEAESEGAWGGKTLEASDFTNIRAAGFQTVRIPVRWDNKTGDAAPYTIDPMWMNRITEVVDEALAADLNVILDSHNFLAVHSDPAGSTAKLADVWRQIAAHFATRPKHRLWFEIENEPHDKLTNANLVATVSPALAAIRETNPDRPVIVGGENWSGIDSLATLDLPDDPNIHPTFHYYEPFDFTHQGANWVDPAPPMGRTYGTEADRARLVADVAKVRAYITRTGLTPFMGETGAYDKGASLDQRVAYTKAVHDAFAELGIGMCGWAYTNTFPYYDYKAKRWLPGMRSAAGLTEQK